MTKHVGAKRQPSAVTRDEKVLFSAAALAGGLAAFAFWLVYAVVIAAAKAKSSKPT